MSYDIVGFIFSLRIDALPAHENKLLKKTKKTKKNKKKQITTNKNN